MAIYYIADMHLGDKNIIDFDNRPFKNVYHMDHELINNWNNKVTDNDTVYIVGDFSWHNEDTTREISDMLKGNKIFIIGSHDNHSNIFIKGENAFKYLKIKDNGKTVILKHIPSLNIESSNIHLYGFWHNATDFEKYRTYLMRNGKHSEYYNIGCMMPYMDYEPKTLDEIITRYNQENNRIIKEGMILQSYIYKCNNKE